MATEEIKLDRLEDCLWEIPLQGGMRVPGRIYASEKLMAGLKADNSLRQVMNVAHLPGIVGYSLAMPDIHWGYGFPIGGVAAVGVDDGVISPGGVGYDINCGVRMVKTAIAGGRAVGCNGRLRQPRGSLTHGRRRKTWVGRCRTH